MFEYKPTIPLPKLDVDVIVERVDGYRKTINIKEGQLVKNLTYLDNGVEKTITGVIRVINFVSKQGLSAKDACIHDDISVFNKYVTVTTLTVDCSDKYVCNVVSVPCVYIRDIESVEDITDNQAVVDGVEYATFTEAIASVKDGSVIKMNEDFQSEEKLSLGDGKSITIDLNGHRMFAPEVENNYSYIIKGDVTFDGAGEVYHGGKFGLGVQPDKKLTINDGIFTSTGDYLIGSWGETVINGGTFKGKYCCINGFAGEVIINGGNFIAEEAENDPEWGWTVILGNVKVTGGTFNHPVHERYCTEGYVPKANEDGTYTVEKVS